MNGPKMYPNLYLEPIANTSTEIYVATSLKPMNLDLFSSIASIHVLDFLFPALVNTLAKALRLPFIPGYNSHLFSNINTSTPV